MIGPRHRFIALAAAALAMSTGCGETQQQKPSTPFRIARTYRIASPTPGRAQRLLLETKAGPATVVSIGGIRRGSDLRLELITPVEVTFEPGTIEATVIAIGDSGATLRATSGGLSAEDATIEIGSRSVSSGCCALPKTFQVNSSRP